MGIFNDPVKEIINPVTKKRDYWTSERIEAYEANYRVKIKDAPKKREKKPKTIEHE